MSIDTRRDDGDYYPGGKRVVTQPVAAGGGDMKHSQFSGLEKLPERFNDSDVKTKLDQVIDLLKGPVPVVAVVMAFAVAFAANGASLNVQTAEKGAIYNDQLVVTNITLNTDGLATDDAVRQAVLTATNYTDSVSESLTSNISVTASAVYRAATNYADHAVAGATPADYSTVSNKAMNALQKTGGTLTGSLDITKMDSSGGNGLRIIEGDEFGGRDDAVYGSEKITYYENGVAIRTYSFTGDGRIATLLDIPTIYNWAKASSKPSYSLNEICPNSENWLGVQGNAGRHIKILAGTSGGAIVGGVRVTASTQNDNNMTTYTYGGVAVRRSGSNTDYLFDATSQNGIVRRSEIAGKAEASEVAAIAATLNAENARFVSTNYNSNAHMPEAYVQAKIDGSWLTVWNEMTRWNWLTSEYLPTSFYTKGQINAALDDKADRAWGFYDSHSGLYAPEDYTWVSSPKIAIAGGLAYSRTLTSEGAVWVLESNGMVAEAGGLTNGFFRISDDEGNALFEIVKGDKRTVGAIANSVQVIAGFTPTKLQIGYAVQSETHPTLQITSSLGDPDWQDETSGSCPATVTWSGVSGAYVATVQAKSASATQLFVKAEYQVGGETYIRNAAPISVDGGILCTDGIHKVRPVYNNGNITWEVVQ